MLKLRERAGQMRLLCPGLDHRDFYDWMPLLHEPRFNAQRFDDACDRHHFAAVVDDGAETLLKCEYCGAELLTPNGENP